MLLISKTYWLGMPFNYRGELPDGVAVEPVHVQSVDMRWVSGLHYRPASSRDRRIGVLVMHPRADFSRHYCIPPLLEAGIRVLGLGTRCVNNDTTAVHEELILDVAAGIQHLREQGAEKVILFGNSGGGSLFAFYQAQAELQPEERIERDPAGKPTKLAKAEMVPAEALLAVSAHPGEGQIILNSIDPAVVDENQPLLSDPELDMYHPDNGFAEPPQESRYSPEFVERFRAGQRRRVEKLDALAHSMIVDAREAERLYRDSREQLSFAERQQIGRRAALEPVMVIYRTMANLHYTDLSLDPSNRGYGSLFSERPDLMNYQFTGFARVLTPAAWLSSWSGLSSNADFCANAARISCPVLQVNALRDREIHPGDAQCMWDAIASRDRTFLEVDAEHYFEPPFGEQHAPDVEKVMKEIIDWINERF